MIQQGRNRPLQVVVWSRAASTSVKVWWCPSLYPKPATHQFTLSTRNQGRCKLLQRNCAAAMSSPKKFVGSPVTISCFSRTACCPSSEVDYGVPAAYSAELHRTACMAPNSPDLNPIDYALWGLYSRACIDLRFPIWRISRTECTPAGRILTNRS